MTTVPRVRIAYTHQFAGAQGFATADLTPETPVPWPPTGQVWDECNRVLCEHLAQNMPGSLAVTMLAITPLADLPAAPPEAAPAAEPQPEPATDP